MRTSHMKKAFLWIIIGLFCFLLIDVINREVVTANTGQQEKGNDDMFPFYWLVIIVGGIIASTLSYVSWRKYKGEQKQKNQETD
ncbi:sporulation protein YpjB [Ornithinibacillus contaminans]|uniref:sporulation protein YpjB n=1 Tax=Ornithinibacillus contaminans TaxID=694055 RepID=UPI00064DCEE9|nr:sporulation protein YpjB [Ornithinibacillus contaminans]